MIIAQEHKVVSSPEVPTSLISISTCENTNTAPIPPGSVAATSFSSVSRIESIRRIYYRYVNPWARFLLVLPILYLYALASAFVTYRTVSLRHRIPVPLSTIFRLPDVGFDIFPTPSYPSAFHRALQAWADFTPVALTVLMFVLLIIRRDIIRLTEYLTIQMFLFSLNALTHIVTTLPDSYALQDACNEVEHRSWGNWAYHMFTFTYCGDMIFSGHTANSVVPSIIIKRMMWDIVGWRFPSLAFLEQKPELPAHSIPPRRSASDVEQILKNINLDFEDPRQRVGKEEAVAEIDRESNNQQSLKISTKPPLKHAQINWEHPATLSPASLRHKVVIEKEAKSPSSDLGTDLFFYVQHCPYLSPGWTASRPGLYIGLVFFLRLIIVLWIITLIITIATIRYHYTVDVLIALMISTLVSTHSRFVQKGVRWLYRPNYQNYYYSSWWRPVYLQQHFTSEQCNYEERVSRAGVGGLI